MVQNVTRTSPKASRQVEIFDPLVREVPVTLASQHRVALVTEDRKAQGLFLKLSVINNTTISGLKALCQAWVLKLGEELALVQKMIKQLRIKTPGQTSWWRT